MIVNRHLNNIRRIRDELYAPKNSDNIPAMRGRVDHESVAIDADQHMTGRLLKQTGICMFHNNYMGSSPEGLVCVDTLFQAASAVCILEVKCP